MSPVASAWLRRLLVPALVVLAHAAFAPRAQAQIVINEVEYDEPSTDTAEFIELKNVGATTVSLSGYALNLVNGASGAASYATYALPAAVSLAPGQYYVVCANAATVPGCNLDVSPDTNLIQNGAPDALALQLNGVVVDRVSYEGDTPGFTEVHGAVADDGANANEGLSRCADGADTNDNSADFQKRPITPGAANSCGTVGGSVGACGDPATKLAAIQGNGTASPLLGQTVNVEAVVVGDFQDSPINGLFLQEEDADQDGDPTTSDGLFVFEGALAVPVAAGTLVRVRGQVAEFDSLTELTGVTDIVACPGAPPATARTLTFPVAAVGELERYEGMLVTIPQTLTVTGNFELGRFGSLDLSVGGRLFQPTNVVAPGAAALARQSLNDRSRIVLDDLATAQDPNPIPYKDASNTRRLGDTLPSLTGILDGRFGVYRIQPTGALTFTSGGPRPATPPAVGGRLRVASFNVLNYFTTTDNGSPLCGPSGGLDCRGADSAAELDRQREKLLNALQALDADVVGLTEIENNASAATQSLVDGLNTRLGASTYGFVNTGSIGTDAIKLAIIFKPAKVSATGAHATLTTAVDPRFIDTKNRPALAQTFTEAATGARFTVVLNHLKSKGSACDDVGDPDQGDGQGNCNGTRTAAAAALLSWIAGDPTDSQDPDFLLMGDLNAYAKEDPITMLEAGGLQSLTATFGGATAASYQFQGQSGYLDHALATASLAPQVTGLGEWHINADEPVSADYNLEFKTDDLFSLAGPFRASDHDPVIVGLALAGAAPTAVPLLGDLAKVGLLVLLLALGAGVVGRPYGRPYLRRVRAPAAPSSIVPTRL